MDPNVRKALHGKISGLLKSMASKRVASKFGASAPVDDEEDASQEVDSPAEELGETPDEETAEGSDGLTDDEKEALARLYSKLS